MIDTVIYILIYAVIITFFILGMNLMIKGKDNSTKTTLGLFVCIYCILLFTYTLPFFSDIINGTPIKSDIIPYGLVLILLLASAIISIFPIYALFPDYTYKRNIVILLIPFLFTLILYFLFYSDLIIETELPDQHSLKANFLFILANIHTPDVLLRFILLLLIIIVPCLSFILQRCFFLPSSHRKPTKLFNINIVLSVTLQIIFILRCLKISHSLLLVSISFTIYLIFIIVGYINNINFLTVILPHKTKENHGEILSTSSVWEKFDSYLKKDDLFISDDIQIDDIAVNLNIKKEIILDVLHDNGYNSYKEYINCLKIDKFKLLAEESPEKDIQELMYDSGFNSKTTFYRLFKLAEDITPKTYILKLYTDNKKRDN